MNCPRCNGDRVERLVDVPGAWVVDLCTRCCYTWRSTEPAAFTRHDQYDPRFRLDAESLAGFRAYPPVPGAKRRG